MRLGFQPLESGARACTFSVQETWTFGSESGCVFGLKGHLAIEDMKTKHRSPGHFLLAGRLVRQAWREGRTRCHPMDPALPVCQAGQDPGRCHPFNVFVFSAPGVAKGSWKMGMGST